jgi:hypothetical protein
MINRIFFILLSILSISNIFGCKSDPASNSNAPSKTTVLSLNGIADGNQWTLWSLEYDPDMTITHSDTVTWSILGTTTFRGHTGYLTLQDGSGLYYAEGDSDLYGVTDAKTANPFIKHVLHYPLELNAPYVLSDTIKFGRREQNTVELLDTEAIITTSAGMFKCFHFRWTGMQGDDSVLDPIKYTSIDHLYYADGVGLIRELDSSYDKGVKYLQTRRELLNYKVK